MERTDRIIINEVTVGTDCELFIVDPIQKEYIPAIGRIGGMKGYPVPIGNGCGLEEDNVAVEFTVPSVSIIGGEEAMWGSIQHCLTEIKRRFPDAYELAIIPSAIFSKEALVDPMARVFGCEPDFNAWKDGSMNPHPKSKNKRLRSCGGHIHIGYNNPYIDVSMAIVRALDVHVTIPSLLIDTDTRRRELYGKAGSFRPKDYGVEYRTISNFWIKDKSYVDWVFAAINNALRAVNQGVDFQSASADIISAINTSNVELASELIHRYEVTTVDAAAV